MTGAAPISSTVEQVRGVVTTTERFKDGSLRVLEADIAEPQTESSAITPSSTPSQAGCAIRTTPYSVVATGCTVKFSSVIYGMSFTFDYTAYNGGGTWISARYGISVWNLAGGVSDKHFEDISSSDTRAYADFSSPVGTFTVFTGVRVSGTSNYAYNS